jgi:hypothetical protein
MANNFVKCPDADLPIRPGEFDDTLTSEADCRALWAAVIGTAVEDGDWDYLDTRGFRDVCGLADLDADYIRKGVEKLKAEQPVVRLRPRDWVFVVGLLNGTPRTRAATDAGYASRAAAERLLSRPEINAALRLYRHGPAHPDTIMK